MFAFEEIIRVFMCDVRLSAFEHESRITFVWVSARVLECKI